MSSATTDSLVAVGTRLLGSVDVLARRILDRIEVEIPELAGDPRSRELLASTVSDNVVSALRIISGRSEDVSPTAPAVAFEFARRLAQQAVPLTSMLRAYRLGQAAFQQVVLSRLGEADLGLAEMTASSLALSSFAFEFIDSISEQLVVVYQDERDDWLRQRNAARLARVQAVLSGTVSDTREVEAAVGVSPTSLLVGAVLWLDAGHDADAGSLDQQLTALAAAMSGPSDGPRRAPTSVSPDSSTLWAWLPGVTDTVLAEGFAPAAGVHIALGRPGVGVDGFRATHREALHVHSLAMYAAPGHAPAVLTATDVGPLALVNATAGDIRSWVRSILGELAGDDDASARLRDTAWSYLASGSSLNTAAAELHLHKNTIQYRLRRAEEARGRPLSEQRLELEVALLACRLLGRTVLSCPEGSTDRNAHP